MEDFQPYRAIKTLGDYQATGTVIAEFVTTRGKTRCVFEFDMPPGMLHIFSMEQVQRVAG